MKFAMRVLVVQLVIQLLLTSVLLAQSRSGEWNALNREAIRMFQLGEYGQAEALAEKSLAIAEQDEGSVNSSHKCTTFG